MQRSLSDFDKSGIVEGGVFTGEDVAERVADEIGGCLSSSRFDDGRGRKSMR